MRISASSHHDSRRDSLRIDTARETIKKISFNPVLAENRIRPGGSGYLVPRMLDLPG